MIEASYREKKKLELTFPFLSWEIDHPSFPLHWHDCFEIMVVSRGGMSIFIDDALFEAAAGDIVLVNAGVVHGFRNSRPGTVIEGFQFDVTLFDESFVGLRDIIFQNPIVGKEAGNGDSRERLRGLFREINREDTEKNIGYQLAVKAKLYEFMVIILRELPRRSAGIQGALSREILALVLKNADEPEFTLEEAACTLKLNKFYFSHLFKRYTGQSFHSYLVQTRITFAKHYLIESKMTITDIAFHSGFNSIQTFNRVFKTLTGFTPRDYRFKNGVGAVRVSRRFS
jgi:AraC-like DNA-binding protein